LNIKKLLVAVLLLAKKQKSHLATINVKNDSGRFGTKTQKNEFPFAQKHCCSFPLKAQRSRGIQTEDRLHLLLKVACLRSVYAENEVVSRSVA
jgi:hypothetical protein